jgi:predicted MFS family arabinose efflux permease
MPEPLYLFFGYMTEFSSIVYVFPQLLRNKELASARSISFVFIAIGIVTAVCDNISAWCLDWPMPSKLGAAFRFLMVCALLMQTIYYMSGFVRLRALCFGRMTRQET